MPPNKVKLPDRAARESFALVATLALLAVATILLVLFVTTTGLDRSASHSYSQSIKADQIGIGGLHLIEGQLQAEMYKDGMPDTNGGASYTPIFTNVASYNIIPQANVTNASLPALIKMSTNLPFFSGTNSLTSYDTGMLQASTTSSTAPSLNGRSVSTNVWNQIYLGQYPNSAAAPYWVVVTRGGPTNAAGISFGKTGDTLNNPATANPNYAVGRIAYAIYDEGGLLDINSAGYTNTISPLSTAQLAQIKGTLAGADLTQIPGITNAPMLIQWRNAASAGTTASNYVYYVTNFASSNGFQQVYPGDSTFVSRQDLIKAAQTGAEGFTTNALPNLATFTREINAPTWAPTTNAPASTAYSYAANAFSPTRPALPAPALSTTQPATQNPNRFVPHVRYPAAGTITSYYPNGTTYTYNVSAGDSLVQHRFPLDRLAWVTPKGPSASLAASDPFYNPGGTAAAIKACFGLQWGSVSASNPDSNWTTLTGNVLWQYVGSPVGSTTEQQSVETLDQVAAEGTPREPNFFELLQAGILSGSLGDFSGVESAYNSTYVVYPRDAQLYSTLQLFRIGASMISQVQSSAYPINIEYSQAQYITQNSGGTTSEVASGTKVALVASGVANLPYLNLFQPLSGLNPVDPGWTSNITPTSDPAHYIATYLLFGLWNPHQQPATQPTRPNVRLYIQGEMTVGVRWAYNQIPTYIATYPGGYGPSLTLPANSTYVDLANTAGNGVNGFFNPGLLTANDVASPAAYSNSHASWFHATQTLGATDPSLVLDPNISYEVFDLRSSTGVPLKINIGGGGTGNSTTACTNDTPGPNRVVFAFNYLSPSTNANKFQIILKYQDTNGNWIPYDYWNGVNDPASWTTGLTVWTGNMSASKSVAGIAAQPDPASVFYIPTLSMDLYEGISPTYGIGFGHVCTTLTCDPRSIRFGPWVASNDGGVNGNASYMASDSLWSGASGATPVNGAFPTTANRNAGYHTAAFAQYGYGLGGGDPGVSSMPFLFASIWTPAFLCRNVPSANISSYTDTDGVQRIADSGLFPAPTGSTAPTAGNPFIYPNANTPSSTAGQRTADRPIILNRPFNSVGELGYTFRDDPWRSLDFFSAYNGQSVSADSGLLDLFTVNDSPNFIMAGRVNLNTRNTSVLAAILSKTMANAGDTVNNTTVANLGTPSGMADALATYTQNKPLVNKDQLVTQFGPTLTSSAFNSGDEQNVKAYREAYVRSLADVGQTRTWNLLIDLVAQSGKFPPPASDLTQFDVEGERHYWLHIAIDRFTGKIIDRQLELIGP